MSKIKKVVLFAMSFVMAVGLFVGCSVPIVSTGSSGTTQGAKGDKGEKGDKGDTGEKGDKGDTGAKGEDGKSAYQIWLEEGNEGTEEDFLAWLKGLNDHTFGEWECYTTDEATPCEKRMYFRICSDCSVIEWKNGTEEDHDWTEWKTTDPNCQEEGFDSRTCEICGKVEKENFTDKLDHPWETEYTADNLYHWYGCETCDDVKDKEEHTLDDVNVCTVCGTTVQKSYLTFITGNPKINPDAAVTTEVAHGATIAFPEAPTAEGKEFIGWVDIEGNVIEEGAVMPEENFAIYATWEVIAYTLTIEQEGYEDLTLKFGVEAVPATETTEEIYEIGTLDYILDTVYLPEKTDTIAYVFEGKPEEGWTLADATISIVETPRVYTVTFINTNDRWALPPTKDLAYGATIEYLTYEVEGMNLNGWIVVDIETNEASEAPATMPASDLTVYTNWEVIVYTLTVKRLDGTTVDTYKFGVQDVYAEDPADAVIGIGWSLDGKLEETKTEDPNGCYEVVYEGMPEGGIKLEDTTLTEKTQLKADATHANASYTYNEDGTHSKACADCGEALESSVACEIGWIEEITEQGTKVKACLSCGGGIVEEIDVTNEKVLEIHIGVDETFAIIDLLDENQKDKYDYTLTVYWGEVMLFDYYKLLEDESNGFANYLAAGGGLPEALNVSQFGDAEGVQTLKFGFLTTDEAVHYMEIKVNLIVN